MYAYRRTVWQCNSKWGGHRCKTPHLTEEEIQQGFIKAMNKLLAIRSDVIANLRDVQAELGGTEDLEAEIARLDNEQTVTGELLQELIDQNARVAQDQTDYQQRSDEMFARYEAAEKALVEAQESLNQKEKHNEQIEDFISEIEAMPDSISEFRTDYWGHLVEKVTVHRKGKLTFSFTCRGRLRFKNEFCWERCTEEVNRESDFMTIRSILSGYLIQCNDEPGNPTNDCESGSK